MQKPYTTLLITSLFTLMAFVVQSQIVISEIISDNQVEIHNQGLDTVDLDQYWLCARPQYDRIGALNASCGTISLNPSEYVVVTTNFAFPTAGGELGIYSSGDFADPASIVDYVIWGDPSGVSRESVAVSAGIWTVGERATAFSDESALIYDGTGDAATDYYVGSGTECAENAALCDVSGGSIVEGDGLTQVSICIDDAVDELVTVSLTGASGSNSAWVVTDTVLNILEIDTSNVFDLESAGAGVCLIWHISYEDDLTGAVVDSNAANLGGCFSLSNSITVTRLSGMDCPGFVSCDVSGGSITTQDGSLAATICTDDDTVELVTASLTGANGTNSAWVITDTALNILEIDTSNVFDLESAGSGVCLIWHISYEDDLTGAVVDSNAANLGGCFSLSNSISVTRLSGMDCPGFVSCDVSGGSITTGDGSLAATICTDDDAAELVTASLTGESGSNSAWVVTDTSLNILEIDTSNVFDLEPAGAGVCLIWHISYEDDLTGAVVDSNAANLGGCFSLSNSITVTRLSGADCGGAVLCDISGGSITTQDGTTSATVCIDDDIEELVTVSLSRALGTNSAWVVTDTALNILKIDTTNVFDLESAGAGVCLIWHLSYEDDLTGAVVDSNAANLGGCFSLSNSITVNRLGGGDCPMQGVCEVEAGSITDQNGDTNVTICTDDQDEELIIVSQSGAVGSNSAFVLTDTSLNILAIETNTTVFSLESRGPGVCLIWHISYEDDLAGANVGANAANLTGCFALSNALTVNRVSGANCDGGTTNPTCDVSGGSIVNQSGTTVSNVCLGDDEEDLVIVSLSGSSGSNSAFVVTDSSLNILAIETNTSVFSLESRGPGVCLIWNISYEDDLTGASIGANAANLGGCFELSNAITVNRFASEDCEMSICEVVAGSLTIEGGETSIDICVGDGVSDAFNVDISGATGTSQGWVITDTSGVILGLPTAPPFDLENTDPGSCLIWHFVADGDLTGVELNANANNISGCFALSNPIRVNRSAGDDCPAPPCEAAGGMITLGDSSTMASICIDDGVSEDISVSLTGSSGSNSAWVVTDTSLTILKIDTTNVFNFDSSGAGVCLIWHLSFEDDLTGAAIDSNAANLGGCFALSNPITITRLAGDACPAPPCEAAGGTIMLSDSSAMASICIDDAVSQDVIVSLSGSSGSNSAWVVTDTSLNILKIDTTNVFNFDSSGAGVCLIWHLSFEDDLTGAVVDSNAANLGGCFSLSNSIRITRLTGDDCPADACVVSGGSLSTTSGTSDIVLCGGDSGLSPISIDLTGEVGSRNAWVITDSLGVIIGFPLAPPFDLSGAREGVYNIWHLSYDGNITGASLGANAGDIEGCFSLSNPLIVRRVDVSASTIAFSDSSESPVTLCVGDGSSNLIDIVSTEGDGPLQSWVITDTAGVILDIPTTLPLDFANVSGGTCLIWQVSHADDLSGAVVGANANDLSGCFALSNPLTVIRNVVAGGTLATDIGGNDITICVGDDEADVLSLSLTNNEGASGSYVITDTTGMILELSADLDQDFDNTEVGVCLIWYISYNDTLAGLSLGANASDLSGCFSLSNPVTLTRVSGDDCPPPCPALGGTITTTDGASEITICVDDELSDAFELTVSGAAGDTLAFVITDDQGNILGINSSFVADFEGTGAGPLHVRYIAYNSGTLIPVVGGNINMLSGCYALSNVFVINRVIDAGCGSVCLAQAGTISSDLGDDISFCTDDGEADIVSFDVSGQSDSIGSFIITDDLGQIIRLTDERSIDFDGTGSGTAFIWYIVYEEDVVGLMEGQNVNDLQGCYDFSNPITITLQAGDQCPVACTTDGGTISAADGSTELEFCAGEVVVSVIHETSNEDTTSTYWYVLTDDEGEIIDWINSDEDSIFNLNRSPAGICRIYGLNATDASGLVEGGDITDSEIGCDKLSSNYITVNKIQGGACDEGCHAPRDIRIVKQGSNRWQVSWDRVSEARQYILLIGYEGQPGSFTEVPLRRNRINLSGPSNRVIVIQIKSECSINESSEFTGPIRLADENTGASTVSTGRSFDIHRGTVLPSGIVISEQAAAFPNPAADRVTIWHDYTEATVQVYDRTGVRVLTKRFSATEEFGDMSIAELQDGLYFLMIESNGEILMQEKLVKSSK